MEDITRKLQTNIPYEYRNNNPQQNISILNLATHQKDYMYHGQVVFIPGIQSDPTYEM